ncbi:MAG: GNAT family N-acetyltransferase [Acidobacteriota bacterium]
MPLFVTPTLQTPRLVLREVRDEDWRQILHLRSDPQVNALVQRPLSKSKQDALAFIRKVAGGNRTGEMIYWGIVLPAANQVVGSICLWQFSADRKTAEVGYDLSVAAQGKGYMTEALQAVLDFGLADLGLTTVEAYTQSNNAASIKLLGRFGFRLLPDRKDADNELNAVYSLNAETGLPDVQDEAAPSNEPPEND